MISTDEETTGIGVDHEAFKELRAHCVMDWEAILVVTPHEHGYEFCTEGDPVVLDRNRMLLLLASLTELLV